VIDGALTGNPSTDDIPTPKCLGDFVKLFRGASPTQAVNLSLVPNFFVVSDYRRTRVTIRPLMGVTDMETALAFIEHCMETSKEAWTWAHRGELHRYGMFPEYYLHVEANFQHEASRILEKELLALNTERGRNDAMGLRKDRALSLRKERRRDLLHLQPMFSRTNAIKILNAMWGGLHESTSILADEWSGLQRWLTCDAPSHVYVDNMLRFAALICCGLGISAFDWSEQRLTPMLAETDRGIRIVLISAAYLSRIVSRSPEIFALEKDLEEEARPKTSFEYKPGVDTTLMAPLAGTMMLTTVGLFPTPDN
jgi:hypothetical protein